MPRTTDKSRRDRIQPILNEWLPILSLTDWELTWELVDFIEGKKDEPIVARVNPVLPYKRVHIRFVRRGVDQCPTEAELEITIIHELIHVITCPLWEEILNQIGSGTVVTNILGGYMETIADTLAIILYQMKTQKPVGAIFSPLKQFKE